MADWFSFLHGIQWQPLEFLALIAALLIVLYLFSRKWNLSFNQDQQVKPFISGHPESSGMQLKAGSIYWGFFQALKGYYIRLEEMHSNCVNDYVYWLVIVLAVVLVVIGVS